MAGRPLGQPEGEEPKRVDAEGGAGGRICCAERERANEVGANTTSGEEFDEGLVGMSGSFKIT